MAFLHYHYNGGEFELARTAERVKMTLTRFFICFAVLCALIKQKEVKYTICVNYIVYVNQKFYQEKHFCEKCVEDCCCNFQPVELQLWHKDQTVHLLLFGRPRLTQPS